MKRKPLRSDWREMPPKRMIPGMSRLQFLLRNHQFMITVDVESLRAFNQAIVAARYPLSSLVSVQRNGDGYRLSYDDSPVVYPAAVCYSGGKIAGTSRQIIKQDQ